MGEPACHVAAGGHGYAAVSLLEGQDVVDPSPVMYTVRPAALRALISFRFCSGVTRLNTVYSVAAAASFLSSSSVRASTYFRRF